MAKRGRKAHVWTAEEDEAIRSLTITAMVGRFGLSAQAVMGRRIELGVPPHKRGRKLIPKVTPAKREIPDFTAILADQLMSSGGCSSKLADMLGVSKQAVHQRVQGANRRAAAKRGVGWEDLSLRKFGRLKAVIDSGRDESGSPLWLCRCKCGKAGMASADALKSGAVDSCGCLAWSECRCGVRFANDGQIFCDECRENAEDSLKDWTGRKFERLVVLRRGPQSRYGQRTWFCLCKCGNETRPIFQHNLERGYSRSCGCLQKEVVSRRMRRVWTPEEDEALKTSTIREMHERFGISNGTIMNRRLELGISPRRAGKKEVVS